MCNSRHKGFRKLAGVGVGRNDQGPAADLTFFGLDDPPVVLPFEADRGRARVNAAAAFQHHARQTARQSEWIDVPTGLVPEAAEPGVRPQHLARLVARKQFDRRTEFRPLSHAPFCDPDSPGRMHRLHPAGLFLFGLNLIAPSDIEQYRGAVTQQTDETFARCTVLRNNVLRVGPRQSRDHLPVVAAGCAPARLHCFDNGDVDARLAQMQRSRQASKAAADDDDIGFGRANEFRQAGTGRRCRGPQRVRPANSSDIHHGPFR